MTDVQSTEKRKGKYWYVLDPDRHFEDLVEAAVKRHEERLHRDERTTSGILKLIIKNIDVCVLAIRPEPVVPPIDEVGASIESVMIPVK